MPDTTTTNFGFTKPEIGASRDTWGNKLNANFDSIDTQINNIKERIPSDDLVYIHGTFPRIQFRDEGEAPNERDWLFTLANGDGSFYPTNDDNSAEGPFFSFHRSGTLETGNSVVRRSTGDGRYVRPDVGNTYSATQTFTVANITTGRISTLNGSLNANNQAMTNVNIDSGNIDGTIIGVNSRQSGFFSNLDSQTGHIDTWNGPTDFNNQVLTGINIDAGFIDNVDIGQNVRRLANFTGVKINSGSAFLPALAFNDENTMGMYRIGAGRTGFAVGSSAKFEINSAELVLYNANLNMNGGTIGGGALNGMTIENSPIGVTTQNVGFFTSLQATGTIVGDHYQARDTSTQMRSSGGHDIIRLQDAPTFRNYHADGNNRGVLSVLSNGVLSHYRSNAVTSSVLISGRSDVGGSSETVFRVDCDGDVRNGTGVYSAFSDERLKSGIVDAGRQTEDILRMRWRNYTHIATQQQHLGLVAQELELTSPNLVEEDDLEIGPERYKSVKYSLVFMKGMKALQETIQDLKEVKDNMAGLDQRIAISLQNQTEILNSLAERIAALEAAS